MYFTVCSFVILLSRLSTHVHPLYLVWFQTLPSGQGGKGERKGLMSNSRGGHCHRCCSHSCNRGQNILTIVFVA